LNCPSEQIEFPSILLPPNISSGSIVDITVARNFDSETRSQNSFASLQSDIFTTFGQQSPEAPVLRCRNATQTSVVLEWDPIKLATAELRSLSLLRNGSKVGNIPRPKEMLSTKISGLAVDTEYVFQLVLKTSAGTYSSDKIAVKTHKMTNLSGITITPGILPSQLRDSLEAAIDRIGAKLIDTVRIDTTHFVCTEGRGQAWEKAMEMNIPVVRPEWVEGCEREGRLIGVSKYYLNADPKHRQLGQPVNIRQEQGAAESRTSLNRSLPVRESQETQKPLPSEPDAQAQASANGTSGSEDEEAGEDEDIEPVERDKVSKVEEEPKARFPGPSTKFRKEEADEAKVSASESDEDDDESDGPHKFDEVKL
jgi:hypothetical protein